MHSVLEQVYIVSCKLLVSELRYDYNMSVSPIMSEYKWLKLLCLLIVSLKYLKYKCKKMLKSDFLENENMIFRDWLTVSAQMSYSFLQMLYNSTIISALLMEKMSVFNK